MPEIKSAFYPHGSHFAVADVNIFQDLKLISTANYVFTCKSLRTKNGFSHICTLDHEQEFSSSKLAEFIEYAKDKDVDVIFAEDMMDSRLADVIAEEMEGRVLFFNPLETITKQEASDGITFINKMEDNLAVLEDALQCQ